MENILQIKRGTDATKISEAILAKGELLVDLNTMKLLVGVDGTANKALVRGGGMYLGKAGIVYQDAVDATNVLSYPNDYTKNYILTTKYSDSGYLEWARINATAPISISYSDGTGYTLTHDTLTSAGTYGPSAAITSSSFGDTFNVPAVTVDKYGHISVATTRSIKMPDGGPITKSITANGFDPCGWSGIINTDAIIQAYDPSTTGFLPILGMTTENGRWAIGSLFGYSVDRLYFQYYNNDLTGDRNIYFDPGAGSCFFNVQGEGDCALRQTRNNGREVRFGIGSGGNNAGIYDGNLNRWIIYCKKNDGTLYSTLWANTEHYITTGEVRYMRVCTLSNGTRYMEFTTQTAQWGVVIWESDRVLKTNIQTSTLKALDYINQIPHFSFNWKESGNHESLGYIAQDLEKIIPSAVFKVGEDGICNIAPSAIIPYLSKAIQELSQEIDDLKRQIQNMET